MGDHFKYRKNKDGTYHIPAKEYKRIEDIFDRLVDGVIGFPSGEDVLDAWLTSSQLRFLGLEEDSDDLTYDGEYETDYWPDDE